MIAKALNDINKEESLMYKGSYASMKLIIYKYTFQLKHNNQDYQSNDDDNDDNYEVYDDDDDDDDHDHEVYDDDDDNDDKYEVYDDNPSNIFP